MYNSQCFPAFVYYLSRSDDQCAFSNGWQVPESLKATQRDWYIAAKESPGTAVMSPAYVDADSGKVVVTISKAITKNGQLIL